MFPICGTMFNKTVSAVDACEDVLKMLLQTSTRSPRGVTLTSLDLFVLHVLIEACQTIMKTHKDRALDLK